MITVNPVKLCGLVDVPVTRVPAPGVNPAVPHSMSHNETPALSVHTKSADVAVTFVAVKKVAAGHAGASSKVTSSIAMSS